MRATGTRVTSRIVVQAGAAVAALSPLAAACGGQAGAPAAATAAPVTITYLTAANADRQDGERKTFDEFERMVPNVKVDIVPAGAAWADVKAKWQVLSTGG